LMHHGASRPVLKDRSSRCWNGPTRAKIAIKKININDNRDIDLHLGIQSIPTIVLFKEGRERNRFVGLQETETLNRVVKKLIDKKQLAQN